MRDRTPPPLDCVADAPGIGPTLPRRVVGGPFLVGVVTVALAGLVSANLYGADPPGGPRIAFFDLQRAVFAVEEGRARLSELDDWALARQDEIAPLVTEVDGLRVRLAEAERRKESVEVATVKARLAVARTRFQHKQASARSELEARQKAIVDEIGGRLREILVRLAVERGIQVVFLRSPDRHVIVSETLDLTDEIVEIHEQQAAEKSRQRAR